MSNIYIQEPPALGKVLLKTTVGDIDLELWTKEAPKACRNFIQLSMEGYYNGTIFHRVVPDFIVQGGDPKGDGTGGESIYGAPFKDEFHTRLRFNRRGLVAMANAGKDDNGSQFFFTLNTTPELQNKHTIFGKVTGETVYNMLKLAEGDIDHNERPAYPHKITGCQVLINPFEDIKPRIKEQEEVIQPKKKKDKGVKNFGLLSFGMEAEEEEDQSTEFRGKPKSTHDLLDDPKLSKVSAVETPKSDTEEDDEERLSEDNIEEEPKMTVESVRNKLLQKKADLDKRARIVQHCGEDKSDDEIEEYYLGKDKKDARKKKLEELRKEVKKLKKEMSHKNTPDSDDDKKEDKKKQHYNKDNEMVQQFEAEQEKYRKNLEKIPKKGASREEHKAWTKKLYENTGLYPDNYTDPKFLVEMKKNINIRNDTFLQSAFGSLRITQRLSTIVIFSLIFTYLYNDWVSANVAFGLSCLATFVGYILFLLVMKLKSSKSLNILEHLKMVLIYLVFGYLFSPILHKLTDTVSTDTIFAATIFMMMLHMIFSDYGISVAIVSNSLSINSAIFGSICLASRLSTPFCAFVLLTVSVQAFVLSPILVRLVWDTRYYVFVFSATTIVSSVLLWNVSQTTFFFFILTVLFVNVYCPYLFIMWQTYKDNIYGPWDEAVVHDADDISNCVGVK